MRIYWEWMCRKAAVSDGRWARTTWRSLRELDRASQETLDQVGRFIDQRLDYEVISKRHMDRGQAEHIISSGIAKAGFSPVGRWKKSFTPEQCCRSSDGGKTLKELGYASRHRGREMGLILPLRATRLLHRTYFSSKLVYKKMDCCALRPVLTGAELNEFVLADDHPAV